MTAVPVAVARRRPPTPAQRSLLASQQRAPQAPMQNMAHLLHIDGPVDGPRLAAAFAEVVAATDVLRTRFTTGPGGETVVELADETAETEIIQLPRADALGWSQRRVGRVLPLDRRAYDSAVLVHEDGTASWYLALHHTVTDAVSSVLVARLTAAAYEGGAIASASYYGWPALAAENPARDRVAREWAGRPPAPRLGHLYERGVPAATAASGRVPVELDDPLAEALQRSIDGPFKGLGADLSWTALLLTATATWLHRVAGADRFAIGLPVHNRSRPDARALIGPLVEVYPVDVVVEADDTFASLHRRLTRALRRTLAGAVPGAAPAGSDVEAVVNVIPELDDEPFASWPTTLRWVHPDAIDPGHLVRVQLSRFGRTELALDLNVRAVAEHRRERAVEHFRTVLRHLAEDPDQRIGGFPLLTPHEARIVDAWGTGPPPPTSIRHVAESLAEALARSDRVALVDGERRWTGAALWEAVSQVAAELRRRGVGGGRVAIEMERSADAVVAILATIVAGGSYVPIDPAQPSARRRSLVDRAGCALVLDRLPPLTDDPVPEPPERALDDEAYLLFTSGSTGEPKGVPITHRGLAEYLAFATDAYLAPGERPTVPLFSALTFDLTVTSLFLPLLTGGRLVVVRGDGTAAVRGIAERTELTWCKATPSHLELLARVLPDDHSLTTLVVGGEAFSATLALRLEQALPDVRIFNEYGPTEAVVGCMIHEREPGRLLGGPDVPIGGPAPGVRLRVVDQYAHDVPPGAVGELHITRPGLTAGYLDGDGDAFVEHDGRRWYRSGDLVRLVDDRTLVYLRRADEQLKIGGIRLDPSEIEAALESHPKVRRAAVRAWAPRHEPAQRHCVRCGLADNVPGTELDGDGVCDRCHAYDAVREQAEAWFRTPDDLLAVRDRARAARRGRHDCVALLSGGKDSTYALFQLVRMGFDVHALTLDNGFISEEAKANVARSVAALGVDHEFATVESMPEIFRDSLERHSNVCHGCFKTIYTIGTNRAAELGAPLVVTGLSRGQLFETRLIPAQFGAQRFDPDAIDAAVVAARRAYHRVDDAVRRTLDTSLFDEDGVFERIAYVDFYRYVDVGLGEMLRFLDEEAPWVRPADTGRSTNCRINAAGIHTHLLEQGYHNYAEPYAWDVRLGHKRRDEALAELDDRDDEAEVAAMLAEVGYAPRRRELLTGWIEPVKGAGEPSPASLRAHLQAVLPAHAVPAAFVVVDELPMTANGKLDADALPPPARAHRSSPTPVVAPTSPMERTIVERWERRLGIDPISVDDDFFALGGDSLAALEVTIALGDELGVELPDAVLFANATPRALARAVAEYLKVPPTGEIAAIGTAPVGPEAGAGGHPPALSTGEQAMLFEHRRRPDDPRYNQGRLYRVEADVDVDRMRSALSAVAARHQPLHWTFGTPRRALEPDEAVELEHRAVADWAVAADIARRLHRRPFDLDRGPLLRCGLLAVGDGSTAIVLVTHHVSTDAGSFDRLWTELVATYHGDRPPAATIGYADHAVWQAARVSADDEGFWLGATDATPPLLLHRPRVPGPDGLRTRVTALRADELRRAGAAPFASVLTALGAVLGRYCDRDEVTIGALVSTRDHPEAERLIGYFLNTLPLAIPAGPDRPLGELRDACGELLAAAMAHRTYPFAEMVAARRRHGAPDPTPQVLVALQDLDDLAFGPGRATQEILFTGSAVGDATFFVQLRNGSVELAIEHRGEAVTGALADQLLADLDRALTATVRSPATPAGELAWSDPGASRLVGPPPDDPVPVVAAIERWMVDVADRPAVRCGESTLTWADLDRRSAAVAGRLLAAGIVPGDRVVVALPRSVALVAAIVGVLRAGAAYVPVDPSYPAPRNRAIAAAAGAAAVLGEAELGLAVPMIDVSPVAPHPTEVATAVTLPPPSLDVSPVAPHPTEVATAVTLPPPSLDGAAYVIFTSGSTGEPRGVEIGHRQLAASTAARAAVYGAGPEAFLVVSSAAFDSSVAGLFWALTSGGTIVLPTDREVHDVDALGALLASGAVSHTLLVPSLYRGILGRVGESARWPEVVIVAGEACPAEVVERHGELHPASRLVNEYGPTEATVWSTWADLTPELVAGVGVPIGTPIAGAWAAVVDRHGALAPGGVVGELLVGGVTVAERYDLVESGRFLAASDLGPGRVFRTGDRAAVVDGVLHFHGRADDQLNVGGLRLEPAEIEAVLTAVDGVGAAVVVARDTRSLDRRMEAVGRDRLAAAMARAATSDDPAAALDAALSDPSHATLVAHLEGNPAELDLDTVRRQAGASLPQAARPTVWAVHARLPRLPNGKLDRDAAAGLPLPTDVPAAVRADGDAVDVLVSMFRDILANPAVGADDDFFDTGGDSLVALELLLRIEQRFGVRPRVSVLFEASTPHRLAGALGLGGGAPTGAPGDALRLRSGAVDRTPLWLWPGADGVLLLFQPLVARLDDDLPVFGVEYPGTRGERPPPATVEELGEHCHRALLAAQPDGPYRMLGYSLGGLVAVDVARRLLADGRSVEFLGAIESGLAGVTDERTRAAKFAAAWRERGAWFAIRRTIGSLRMRLGEVTESLRATVEGRMIDRLGVRPSDRLLFLRMQHALRAAGLRYRPPEIDAAVDVYLGDDVSDHWLAAMTREWGAVAGRGADVTQVAGSHVDNTMLLPPHVDSLAETVSKRLDARR